MFEKNGKVPLPKLEELKSAIYLSEYVLIEPESELEHEVEFSKRYFIF